MRFRQAILLCFAAFLLISGGLPEKQRRDRHDHGEATEQRSSAPEAEMAVPDGRSLADEKESPRSVEKDSAESRYLSADSPQKVKSKSGRTKRRNGWALGLGVLFSLGALTAMGRHKARMQRRTGQSHRTKSGKPRFPDWFSATIGILVGIVIAFGVFMLVGVLLEAFPVFGLMALALLAALVLSVAVALLLALVWNIISPRKHSHGPAGCAEGLARGLIAILFIIPLSLLLGGLAVPFFLEWIALIAVSFWTGFGVWLICGAGLVIAYGVGMYIYIQLMIAEKAEKEAEGEKKEKVEETERDEND